MNVVRDWIPRNEYTTPLQGRPDYRISGIIKAEVGKDRIQVGRIDYEHFDTEEFQYIITPFWAIIDTLPAKYFQGIPGIDMDLRLEHYYRVNIEPVFITERTPGRNRVDLWDLLGSVGLTYYDRLEWLIRTDLKAAVDNLIVERAREESKEWQVWCREDAEAVIVSGQMGDVVIVPSLEVLGRTLQEVTNVLRMFCYTGVQLKVIEQGITINTEDYHAIIPLLSYQLSHLKEQYREAQSAGIAAAKAQDKYKGRKRLDVDDRLLLELWYKVNDGTMELKEALDIMGISRSTFYRRVRELSNKN